MSFLQGLRAGTSSSTSSTSYRPIYVKKSYDVIIRHATTASPEKQAYEAAIKKQQQVAKQQQRAAGRLGDNASHMMDITEMPLLGEYTAHCQAEYAESVKLARRKNLFRGNGC